MGTSVPIFIIMPIYAFKCPKCGTEFDKIVRIGTESTACSCGSDAKKQLSAPGGFVLKGSGFYKPSSPQPKS